MNDIKVSVVCTVYNHEEYLREALEGFVSQKTNFAFEALVHDDASTDRSASIIREYEQKYPDIIKPIYQTENQYSKGRKIILDILIPKAKGKYIAICEGDDCWIDPNKLQRQYDLLEERQDVDICTHNAKIMYRSHYCGQTHITNSEIETIPFKDFVVGGRGFIPTMSAMLRKNVFERSETSFLRIKCFDVSLWVAASLRGGMLALSDVMSVYHIYTSESWTVRNRQSENQLHINVIKEYARALEKLNQDTDYRFNTILSDKIAELKYTAATYEKNYSDVVKDSAFRFFNRRMKVRIWLYYFHLGWLGELLSYLKKTISEIFNKSNMSHPIYGSFKASFLPYEIPPYFFGYGTYPPRESNDIKSQKNIKETQE